MVRVRNTTLGSQTGEPVNSAALPTLPYHADGFGAAAVPHRVKPEDGGCPGHGQEAEAAACWLVQKTGVVVEAVGAAGGVVRSTRESVRGDQSNSEQFRAIQYEGF